AEDRAQMAATNAQAMGPIPQQDAAPMGGNFNNNNANNAGNVVALASTENTLGGALPPTTRDLAQQAAAEQSAREQTQRSEQMAQSNYQTQNNETYAYSSPPPVQQASNFDATSGGAPQTSYFGK